MSRLRWLLLLCLGLPLTWGCYEIRGSAEDAVLRAWATRVDDWADEVENWQENTVRPAIRSVCELEGFVYDQLHSVPPTATTRRICPTGSSSDPPPPPGDPIDWDE